MPMQAIPAPMAAAAVASVSKLLVFVIVAVGTLVSWRQVAGEVD
jgi:hypothetical protein